MSVILLFQTFSFLASGVPYFTYVLRSPSPERLLSSVVVWRPLFFTCRRSLRRLSLPVVEDCYFVASLVYGHPVAQRVTCCGGAACVRSRWCVFAVRIVPLLCSCQRQCGARQVPRFILIPLSPCGDAHSLCIKVTLSSARLERQCCAISICYTPCAVPLTVVSFRFYTVNILEKSFLIHRGI